MLKIAKVVNGKVIIKLIPIRKEFCSPSYVGFHYKRSKGIYLTTELCQMTTVKMVGIKELTKKIQDSHCDLVEQCIYISLIIFVKLASILAC